MLITLTNAAKAYLAKLIAAQASLLKANQLNLRLKAINPGTEQANIELAYCDHTEYSELDLAIDFDIFILYIDPLSIHALKDASIDYKEDHQGNPNNTASTLTTNQLSNKGKLHIKAPFLKSGINTIRKPNIASLNKQQINILTIAIKNFLHEKITPYLAKHGGITELKSINCLEHGLELVLEFGGGCKGCSMISFTLKNSVEKLLKNAFPEIINIIDATNHDNGTNPFY
jgi:Fe/S biogenesis protein NfuA